MNVSTVILITLGGLFAYYAGMISYDMYRVRLAQANKDEDEEHAVDISGQAADFKSIPVNKTDEAETKKNRFENLLRAGITAEKASRMIHSISEGTPAKGLQNIMFCIQEYQATATNP